MSYIVYDMDKTVTVRELQQNLKRVLARVERGETIDLTRRRRPIARLIPIRPAGPTEPWPDLDKRARRIFGNRVVRPAASEQLIKDRGER